MLSTSRGKPPVSKLGGDKFRSLVVEDEAMNRLIAVQILEGLGFLDIDAVTNGSEAVAKVRDKAYDMILMDVHMPVMDGLEATRRIRSLALAEGQPQIIALSAAGDPRSAMRAGMDGFIRKPLSARQMKAFLDP